MSNTLYWLQCAACGGDTHSLLDASRPGLPEVLRVLDVEILWHPALSAGTPSEHRDLLAALRTGGQRLDVLVVEGAVARGPAGSGLYDTMMGRPKMAVLADLTRRARFVVAAGTCAAYGGIAAEGEIDGCGVQFHRGEPGGLLGEAFRSASGLPAINLPGCPAHGDVLVGTLSALLGGRDLSLGPSNTPLAWYDMFVHQGCTRNEYHEYRVEEHAFGEKGCLFFHMGCNGPLAHGPCNKVLWNGRSSKTRVGVPCFGCTRPDFPQPHPFFETHNIEGIPRELPDGVDRAHYLAYKGMAAAAAPERLKSRKTSV